MLEFQVKTPSKMAFTDEIRKAVDFAGDNMAEHWERTAKEILQSETKGGTGNLARSIHAQYLPEEMLITIGSPLSYAEDVEFGTKAHEIKPRYKKALTIPRAGGRLVQRKGKAKTAFEYGGKTKITDALLVKRVWHPGTKGIHYIRRAVESSMPEMIDELKMFIGDVKITAKR